MKTKWTKDELLANKRADMTQALMVYGETQATAKELDYFVLNSSQMTIAGEFHFIYKGVVLFFNLKYRKISPGVYYVYLEKYKEEIERVDNRNSGVIQ